MEEGRSAFKIFPSIPAGKRPLGRLRGRWEGNIRMNNKEIGINTRNCVDLAWECSCECVIKPPGCISHGVSWLERNTKTYDDEIILVIAPENYRQFKNEFEN